MVDLSHRAYWDAAEQHGWIVISPVAPEGRLFFDGAEKLIPPLLEDLRERFAVEGDAFHIAGISNGGIAAFRVAENDPLLFCSILAAPGLPGNDDDFERLGALRHIPVHMVVGEGDASWVTRMRATEAELRALEVPVELVVLPDVGHVIAGVYPEAAVFAQLESQRLGCREGAERRAAQARPQNSASD
jgi:pimeloyl-ACP methyl ester carboxylesterase